MPFDPAGNYIPDVATAAPGNRSSVWPAAAGQVPGQVVGGAPEARLRLMQALAARKQAEMDAGSQGKFEVNPLNPMSAAQRLRRLDQAGGFQSPPTPEAVQAGAQGAGMPRASWADVLNSAGMTGNE